MQKRVADDLYSRTIRRVSYDVRVRGIVSQKIPHRESAVYSINNIRAGCCDAAKASSIDNRANPAARIMQPSDCWKVIKQSGDRPVRLDVPVSRRPLILRVSSAHPGDSD
jgi:hypothetical protein